MEDINIKINRENRTVIANKYCIGNDGENLQGNIVFSFDEFVNGQARLEYVIKGAKAYQMLEKDGETYKIPIKKVLTKEGTIDMQLVITIGTDETETSVFKSNIFSMFCDRSINSEIEQPDEYLTWIEVANTKLNEIDEALTEINEIKDYATEQADYAKETSDTLNLKLEKGELDGATFVPNLDEEGNLSWSNNKNLENPQTQNIRGPQGVMGPQGEAFKIKKTYSSKDEMLADFENMEIGDYVMITSNIEVEDNAKLYSKGEIEWVFITDFSGATGIQGPQGIQGIQGIQGVQGPKGDKPVKGVDYFTEAEQNEMVAEITDNANSVFNQNVTEKTNEFNTNAEAKVNEFNETVDSLQEEIDDLYNNQMFNEASGESIYLTDSANAKVSYLEIEGNSHQETTTGKNKLSILPYKDYVSNGITTSFDGRTFSYSGTLTSSWFDLCKNHDTNLQAGRYLLSVTSKDLNRVALGITYEDGTYGVFYIITNTTKVVFETTKVVTKIRLFNDGQTTGDVLSGTIECCMLEPMISGNIPTEYEPYTGGIASPNPDYPQEVKVVETTNIFDKNNLLKTTLFPDDASMTLKSNNSANGFYIECEPNTTYTIKRHFNTTADIIASSSIELPVVNGTINSFEKKTGTNAITIKTGKNDKYLHVYYYWGTDEIVKQSMLDTIQITKGSKMKPYLPYGKIGIKVVAKNKFNKESCIDGRYYNDEGNIVYEGSSFVSDYIDVISDTYTLSIKDTVNALRICTFDKNKNFIRRITTTGKTTLSIEITENEKYVVVSSNELTNKDSMMFEKGSSATEYEPYKELISYIDLKGNFAGKLPNGTRDRAYIKNNHLYLEKRVNKVVLNGSENIKSPSENYFNIDGLFDGYLMNLNTITYKSTHFEAIGQTASDSAFKTNSANLDYCFNFSTASYTIRFKHSDISTVEEFKTWLSENNVTIYYELAEPQIIDLGYIKHLKH